MTDHCWEDLAEAVILQAVKDYRRAWMRKKRSRNWEKAMTTIWELERFFRSGWFEVLTELNGDAILRKLKEGEELTTAGGGNIVRSEVIRNKRSVRGTAAPIEIAGGAV